MISKRFWIFLLLILNPMIGAVGECKSNLPKPLQGLHGGTTYPVACSQGELRKLKAEIYRLSGKRSPENAWQVVSTLLCGEGEKAERFFRDHTAERVTSTVFGAGDEKAAAKDVDGNRLLLVKKQAWGVAAGGGPEEIRVSYWKNEACLARFDISFNGVKWLVAAVEEACD